MESWERDIKMHIQTLEIWLSVTLQLAFLIGPPDVSDASRVTL